MYRDFAITEVAYLLHLRLVKTHNNISADYVCPFCGKKKLNVNLTNNKFRCAACGEYGNALTLYAKLNGLSNSEAYKKLKDEEEITSIGYITQSPQPVAEKKVYVPDTELRALLNAFGLSYAHRENLKSRGLSDSQIEKYNFKSLLLIGQSNILNGLRQKGIDIEKKPGGYKEFSSYKLNCSGEGILVPSYYDGKLRGVQIRLDKYSKRKYIWLSATAKGGVSSGSPVTYLKGTEKEKILFVTEGILKAIIFHELTGCSVVGVPGVDCQTELPKIFTETRCEYIANVFDMDYLTNPNVKKAENKLKNCAEKHNKKYIRLVWNKDYKGIDDYLSSSKDYVMKELKCLKA